MNRSIHRTSPTALALVLGVSLALGAPGAASAAKPLFSTGALGAFDATNATGPVVFNTDNGSYTVPGVGSFNGGTVVSQGPGHVEIMAFHFTTFLLPAGKTIVGRGQRALALLATQAATVNGVIDVSGAAPAENLNGADGGPGAGGGGGGGEAVDIHIFSSGGKGGLGEGGGGNARGDVGSAQAGTTGVAPGRGGSLGVGGKGGGGAGPSICLDMNDPQAGGGGGGGYGGGSGAGWGSTTGCEMGLATGSGGGGGYGSDGQNGTRMGGVLPQVPGGMSYGSPDLPFLDGGSGGGGSADGNDGPTAPSGGGGGGGALLVSSLVGITVGPTGAVHADGGTTPSDTRWGSGGGGSGGAVILDAPTVVNLGAVTVCGGKGGINTICNYTAKAGDGGGGRVAIYSDKPTLGTVDLCGGSVKVVPFNGKCTNVDCDNGNPCQTSTCEDNVGCIYTNKLDGAICSDGNKCAIGNEVCKAGTCTPVQTVKCTASDACHTAGTCDPKSGVCSSPPAPDGTACSTGNKCVGGETCSAGKCGSPKTTVACAPADSCHDAGKCDPASGLCSSPVKPDGSMCSSGNLCVTGETCKGGTCGSPTGQTNCVASDACHLAGICQPLTGKCTNPAAPDGTKCSSGNLCLSGETCTGGMCGSPTMTTTCPANDMCGAAGSCNPATGTCVYADKCDGGAPDFAMPDLKPPADMTVVDLAMPDLAPKADLKAQPDLNPGIDATAPAPDAAAPTGSPVSFAGGGCNCSVAERGADPTGSSLAALLLLGAFALRTRRRRR